ncbi:MAG: GIY-YIG nuclease family protein, partial [Bacteroidales bacterium]
SRPHRKREYHLLPFFSMDYYVYIIQSETTGIFYKGFSSNPELRLIQHNSGMSRYTDGKGPWKMVYLEKLKDKTGALIREKQLKRANLDYIRWILKQDINMVR